MRFDGTQERRGVLAEAQNAGIGRRAMLCGKVSGNAQQNMRTEAGEPRMRIAFALDGGNQLLAGGGGLRYSSPSSMPTISRREAASIVRRR